MLETLNNKLFQPLFKLWPMFSNTLILLEMMQIKFNLIDFQLNFTFVYSRPTTPDPADPEQEMISQTKEFQGEPYGAAEERTS